MSSNRVIKFKLTITRLIFRIMVLFLITFLGYIIMPFLQQLNIIMPLLNVPLVTLGSVTILAIIGIMLYRIFIDVISLINPISKVMKKIFKSLAKDHITLAKRALYDILFIIIILIALIILLPIASFIPIVGVYFVTALPIMAFAIIVLIFWDLGKIIYNELEELVELIAEKIESVSE